MNGAVNQPMHMPITHHQMPTDQMQVDFKPAPYVTAVTHVTSDIFQGHNGDMDGPYMGDGIKSESILPSQSQPTMQPLPPIQTHHTYPPRPHQSRGRIPARAYSSPPRYNQNQNHAPHSLLQSISQRMPQHPMHHQYQSQSHPASPSLSMSGSIREWDQESASSYGSPQPLSTPVRKKKSGDNSSERRGNRKTLSKSARLVEEKILEIATMKDEVFRMVSEAERSIRENRSDMNTLNRYLMNSRQAITQTESLLSSLLLLKTYESLLADVYESEFTLKIFMHELKLRAPVADLFVRSQPFPCVVKQNQQLSRPLELKLVMGALTRCVHEDNKVEAEMVVWKAESGDPIVVATTKLQPNWCVTLDQLKLKRGSGGKKMHLTYHLALNALTLLSPPHHPHHQPNLIQPYRLQAQTQPQVQGPTTMQQGGSHMGNDQRYISAQQKGEFIVITNTKQWVEAASVICRDHIFVDSYETDPQPVSIFRFCNLVHVHYFEWTRQPTHSHHKTSLRELSKYDLLFFFRHILKRSISKLEPGMTETVTLAEFKQLWEWLGPILHRIRYTKYMLQMWIHGLLWGFISRNEAERQLQGSNVDTGTFLIRFSTKTSKLAIAYKQAPDQVRHYLVDDVAVMKHGSFPDFVKNNESLLNFMRVECHDGVMKTSRPEKIKALRLAKIKTIKSKVKEEPKADYDDTIFKLASDLHVMQL